MRDSIGAKSPRLAPLLHLSLLLSACLSWQTQQVSPARLVTEERPSLVRVTRTDSSRVVLREPVVRGDTLFGYLPSGTDTLSQTAVPLEEAREIAIQRPDPNKNTLLGAGFVIGIFSALCFLADAFGCGSRINY